MPDHCFTQLANFGANTPFTAGGSQQGLKQFSDLQAAKALHSWDRPLLLSNLYYSMNEPLSDDPLMQSGAASAASLRSLQWDGLDLNGTPGAKVHTFNFFEYFRERGLSTIVLLVDDDEGILNVGFSAERVDQVHRVTGLPLGTDIKYLSSTLTFKGKYNFVQLDPKS